MKILHVFINEELFDSAVEKEVEKLQQRIERIVKILPSLKGRIRTVETEVEF